MRRIVFVSALFCAAGMTAGCLGEEDITAMDQLLVIDHYMVPCYSEGPDLCMREIAPESGDAAAFRGPIEGFSYEWGRRYTLRVAISEVADPPADGSSLRYELVEVMSDEPVDERFELVLSPDHVTGDPVSGGFGLLDMRTIWCAEISVCEAIAASLDAGRSVEVELSHGSSPSEPMMAHAARDAE